MSERMNRILERVTNSNDADPSAEVWATRVASCLVTVVASEDQFDYDRMLELFEDLLVKAPADTVASAALSIMRVRQTIANSN